MKNKLLGLEFVRGAAALLVVFGHLKKYIPSLASYNNHIIQLFLNWGTECVIMFFILSGIVVHYSFDQKPKSNLIFLKHRVIRLHPTLLIALLLSLIVEYYCFRNYPSANTIIGNLIPYSTTQGYLALLLWNTNPAIWSLTFEVFFYAVFALFIIKDKSIKYKRISLWLFLSLIAFFFYDNKATNVFFSHVITMLSFSTIWLIGFYIYKLRNKIYTDVSLALMSLSLLPIVSRLHLLPNYYDPLKYSLFSLSTVPFFLLLLNEKKTVEITLIEKKHVHIFLASIYLFSVLMISMDSTYYITSKILYLTLPVFTFICCNINWALNYIITVASKYVIPFFAYFGKYSYSIYVIHIPIIIFISKTCQFNVYGQISIILVLTFFSSYLIENYIQPYIKKKLL